MSKTIYLLGLLALPACAAGAGAQAHVASVARVPVVHEQPKKEIQSPQLEYHADSESDRVFIENAERAIGEYSEFLVRAGDREEYAQAVERSREQIQDLQAALVFIRAGAQERAFRQQ